MNQHHLLPPTEPDDPASLSDSERFRVLADDRRRLVLDVLGDSDAPVGLDALATAIDARDARTARADADDVRIELHHVHLPKLDDAGLVEYDPAAGAVESTAAVGR